MFTQAVTNIAPVIQLTSVQEITLPKSALKINSLVEISVIDKAHSIYRILAGGKVFETKLPVPLNAGESFAAVVANNNPTIFRLNNLFNNFPIDKAIAEILSKLNLPMNSASKNILTSILESDKPVIKSKLKKLLELVNDSETELDKSAIDLFAQLIWSSESFEGFDPNDLKHFVYSTDDLSKKILIELRQLNKINPENEILTSLNNWLILDTNEFSDNPDLMIYKMKHFQSSLSAWLDSKSNDKTTLTYSLLNSLNVQAHYRKLSGINNGMFVVRSNNDLNYSTYELKYPGQSEEVFFFKLQMNPSYLGQVNIEGFYNQNNIRINFISESRTKDILQNNSEDLSAVLSDNARLNASISTNVYGYKTTPAFSQLYSKKNINVTA